MSYLVMYIFIHVYVFWFKDSYLCFILTYEQYYITHELIILLPSDNLVLFFQLCVI